MIQLQALLRRACAEPWSVELVAAYAFAAGFTLAVLIFGGGTVL